MKQNLTPRLNRMESNLIIDGGMELWPEGTSRALTTGIALYGSVLMQAQNDSAGAITITNSRQASVPSGTNLIYSNQLSKTAAGTLNPGSIVRWRYMIEGYDLQKLWNNEFSIVFWVKSSVASNRSVAIRNGVSVTHSYVQQYNIAAANTWEMKVLSFPALSACPGALDRTNGGGLNVTWNAVVGSTFQTSSLNQWVAGNFISGIGEDTTWLTGTNHDFSIAGVMILPGDWTALTASGYSFVRAGRNFQEEVAMSQRYFAKSYDLGVDPATITSTGRESYTTAGAAFYRGTVNFKQQLRSSPTATMYGHLSGATGVSQRDAGTAVGSFSLTVSERGFTYQSAGHTINVEYSFQWTADARF
jgi:hypothetical protein